MAYKSPNLEQLRQALRNGICATCPYRKRKVEGAGMRRTCEDACPLFVNLPILKDRAEKLEPMIGRHEHVLSELIGELDQAQGKRPAKSGSDRNALRRHRRRASRILARLTSV